MQGQAGHHGQLGHERDTGLTCILRKVVRVIKNRCQCSIVWRQTDSIDKLDNQLDDKQW